MQTALPLAVLVLGQHPNTLCPTRDNTCCKNAKSGMSELVCAFVSFHSLMTQVPTYKTCRQDNWEESQPDGEQQGHGRLDWADKDPPWLLQVSQQHSQRLQGTGREGRSCGHLHSRFRL